MYLLVRRGGYAMNFPCWARVVRNTRTLTGILLKKGDLVWAVRDDNFGNYPITCFGVKCSRGDS